MPLFPFVETRVTVVADMYPFENRNRHQTHLLVPYRKPQTKCVRVYSIYQIMMGWKTYKHDYEPDELPNPRPTRPKKKQVKIGVWAAFPPRQQILFRGLGLILCRKQTTRKPKPTKYSATTLLKQVFQHIARITDLHFMT